MKRLVTLFTFLLLFLLSACSSGSEPVQISDEVRFGMILPLTGQTSSLGDYAKEGVDLAFAEAAPDFMVNGTRIKLIYEDDQGVVKNAVSAAAKLIEIDKVSAIMAARSSVSLGIGPILEKAGIPGLMVAAVPAAIDVNKYALRFWVSAEVEGRQLAEESLRRGYQKVAVVTALDDYTLSVNDAFQNTFIAAGGKIVMDERVQITDRDMRGLALRVVTSKADLLFNNTSGGQMALFAKQVKEAGFSGGSVANVFLDSQDEVEAASGALDGTFSVSPAATDDFVQRYLKYHGRKPTSYSIIWYDGALSLINAVRNDMRTPKQIFSFLENMDTISGAGGPFTIRDREGDFVMVLKEVVAGTIVTSELP